MKSTAFSPGPVKPVTLRMRSGIATLTGLVVYTYSSVVIINTGGYMQVNNVSTFMYNTMCPN